MVHILKGVLIHEQLQDLGQALGNHHTADAFLGAGLDDVVQVGAHLLGQVAALAVILAGQHFVHPVDLCVSIIILAPHGFQLRNGGFLVAAVLLQIGQNIHVVLIPAEVKGTLVDQTLDAVHGCNGGIKDGGQTGEIAVELAALLSVAQVLVVEAILTQHHINTTGDGVIHGVARGVGIIGKVALGRQTEQVVFGGNILNIISDDTGLVQIPEGNVNVVGLAGFHIQHHGDLAFHGKHSLIPLVDQQLGAVLVEDPAVHALGGFVVGGDAVNTAAGGDKLRHQASGHNGTAVIVEIVGLHAHAQLGFISRVGGQALDGVLQLLIRAVDLVVHAQAQPFVVVLAVEACHLVHDLQVLCQLLIHGADTQQVGVGGIVEILHQLLIIIVTVQGDHAVVGHVPQGLLFAELGIVHHIAQQQRSVLGAHMVVAVRFIVDHILVGVGEAVVRRGRHLAGQLGDGVYFACVHNAHILNVYGIVAFVIGLVLQVAQSHLIGAVLQGHPGIAGLPGLFFAHTGHLENILAVHDDHHGIVEIFTGDQVIKADGLTGFQLHIHIHDGVGILNAGVGGLDAGFTVLLGNDEGPGIFAALGTVGHGDVAIVDGSHDLLGGGHLVGGLHDGDHIVHTAGTQLLLIIVAGEVLKHAHKGTQAGQTAYLDQADHAVAVHHHRGGVAGDAEGLAPGSRTCGHGEAEAHAGLISRNSLGLLQGIQGDHAHTVLIELISFLHIGELVGTGAAGGKEEVQKNHVLFLQHVGKGNCFAGCSGDGEIVHHIAQAQSHIGQAVVGDQGGLQPDAGHIAAEAVAVRHGITLGGTGNGDGIAVGLGQAEGSSALRIGLAVALQVRKRVVCIDIHIQPFHGHSACGGHCDLIGRRGPGRGLFVIIAGSLFLAAANKHGGHGQQHCHHQKDRQQFFEVLHIFLLFVAKFGTFLRKYR